MSAVAVWLILSQFALAEVVVFFGGSEFQRSELGAYVRAVTERLGF